jgi:serine protease AprX
MKGRKLLAGHAVILSTLAALSGGTESVFADVGAQGGSSVRLRYASFDPLAGVPTPPATLRAAAGNELFLVQFHGTPRDSMRAEIAALGGVVERFLTDNTHVVRMAPEASGKVAALPHVRWVGPYETAYRLSDEVRAHILADDGVARLYSIETMRAGPAQQLALADLVAKLGGEVVIITPDQYRMEARLTPRQVLLVAQRNEVNFIDPGTGGLMETDMDIMRQVGGAVPTLSTAGFEGQGVRGEVFDGGVALNHEQWNGQTPLLHGTTSQSSHGAACYGINFATGTGNILATGMLPQREHGIFCASSNVTQFGGQFTRLTFNMQATDPLGPYRSVFQTSSVGSTRVLTYSTISAEVDDYLWRVDYLSCQSQSNAGGTRDSRPQAWAKNIVAVGGLTHNNTVTYADDAWATGASVGPADDLRQKPDLSHSFNNVFTTSYSTATPTSTYTQFSGTSSATPITAGHFGLLHQMWHEGVWQGFGGATSVFDSRPKSTTAKALAINTAHRYPIGQGGMYRARVGWGMIHVGNMHALRDRTFIVNESAVLTDAQTATYVLQVAPGEPEFKATMVFADPPGNPAALQDRVNDLTLRVTAPDGTVYYGNNGMVATAISGAGQLAGANYSVPGGAPNTVDTVENVFVQNPAAGAWTVEVIAAQVVQDAHRETTAVTDADFALVVTGVTAGGGGSCYANCDGSTEPPVLNVADFTCFLQRFAAGESYANCDGSTAVPVLNVADFTCFLQRFAEGCP